MNPLDYSRWNNLDVSDEESENEKEVSHEEQNCSEPNCPHFHSHHRLNRQPPSKLHENRKALYSIEGNNLSMPKTSMNHISMPVPVKGMTIMPPKLPVNYVGSPIQRMQYR
jgi:hypothetical protein